MKIADYKNNPELCKESFKKVKEVNEKLNAVISFLPEEINEKEGLFKNVPVAVKDNFNVEGSITTAGCRVLDNYESVYDATVIKKLKEAGATLVCKSSMDELAMGGTNITSLIGPCLNPYDLKRISGGSSGGSAVLVASGAVPFALGSDTGDSVRKPASFNGIVGVKPSYGRISRYGVIPYASSLDHVGYFTTNVYDSACALEVLAGRDDNDMTSSYKEVEKYSLAGNDVKGKKILVFNNVLEAINNSEVKDMFNKYVSYLKEKGAEVKIINFDNDLMRALLPVYYIIANAEAATNHANLSGIDFGHRIDGETVEEIMINTRTAGFGPWIKKRFVIGSYALAQENQEYIFRKAQKVRRKIVSEVMKYLAEADALIAPASGGVAPLLEGQGTDELSDEYLIAENHMVIANFAGLPSMTVPMGYLNELPIGLNITCNPFKEKDMFTIAQAIEDCSGLKDKTKEDF